MSKLSQILQKDLQSGFTKVGKITDAKGLKGEVKIHLFSGEASWAHRIPSLVIESKSFPKEYFVEKASVQNKRLIVKLKSVNDRDEALALKGSEVFIGSHFFDSEPGEKIYLKELLGFTVVSEKAEEIGIVTGFETNTVQDLLVVKKGEKVFLVPLIREFLKSIDFRSKKIFMNLPEGLDEVDNRAL